MMYYKRAEKNLALVSDDIEKAEFAFKMAEIFYNLKQTYVSMSYAVQALETYQMYETYTVRRIQCEFVIAGNYDDMQYPERALPHLELALDLAKKEGNPRLISSALYNLGNCYEKMGELQKAAEYFEKSVSICKSEKFDNLPHSIYSLTQVLYKQKNDAEAQKSIVKDWKSPVNTVMNYLWSFFNFYMRYTEKTLTQNRSHTPFNFLKNICCILILKSWRMMLPNSI